MTLFEEKFSIAYEVAARENPKLFVLYAPTSRCIAVIPSPNEGVYHIQFPRSCSHGLVFSDTAISGTCQKCATKIIGHSFMFLLWKCNDEDIILTIFYRKVQKCVIKNALKIYIDVLVCWVNVLIIMTSHMTRWLTDIKFSKFLLWTELIRADWGRWQQLMWQMQKETDLTKEDSVTEQIRPHSNY